MNKIAEFRLIEKVALSPKFIEKRMVYRLKSLVKKKPSLYSILDNTRADKIKDPDIKKTLKQFGSIKGMASRSKRYSKLIKKQ